MTYDASMEEIPHTRKLAVINGLRGIAIIAILYTHLWKQYTPAGWHGFSVRGVPLFPFTFLSNAHQGVALFFFLSGFVLFLPYASETRVMHTLRDARSFLLRRARRLLPLYYISVLVCIIFVYPEKILRSILLMGTLTFNFSPDMYFPPLNTPLWSIGIEWWMCLLFPVVVHAMSRFDVRRVLLTILLLSLVMRIAGTWRPVYAHGDFNMITNSVIGRFDDFGWGMALAFLFTVRRSALKSWWFPAGVVSVFASFTLTDWISLGFASPSLTPFTNIVLDVGFFLVTGSLLGGSLRFIRRIIASWPLQMLGLMCYSVYIWHVVLINPLHATLDATHFVQYLVVLFLLSFLSYRFIEFGHVKEIRTIMPVSGG